MIPWPSSAECGSTAGLFAAKLEAGAVHHASEGRLVMTSESRLQVSSFSVAQLICRACTSRQCNI
jgi:hypothetical protein